METFGNFQFNILHDRIRGWEYIIYDNKFMPVKGSEEFFKTKSAARYAAIGHIAILDKKINPESEHS